jgi:hypothetical protein
MIIEILEYVNEPDQMAIRYIIRQSRPLAKNVEKGDQQYPCSNNNRN